MLLFLTNALSLPHVKHVILPAAQQVYISMPAAWLQHSSAKVAAYVTQFWQEAMGSAEEAQLSCGWSWNARLSWHQQCNLMTFDSEYDSAQSHTQCDQQQSRQASMLYIFLSQT